MAVTSFAAIRDAQVAAIKAITPTVRSDIQFVPVLDETDIRSWSGGNPQAATRRFSIYWLGEEREGVILQAERVHVDAEIVVAYLATPMRYGAENIRDRQDFLESDRKDVEKAAGVVGYPNLTVDATVYRSSWTVERGDGVVFLVLSYTVAFSRSTGL